MTPRRRTRRESADMARRQDKNQETAVEEIKYFTCRFQNSHIPRAGHVGAHGGVAKQSRAGLFANRTVRLENNPFSVVCRGSL